MSAPTIAAIPTKYAGVQFRSRLEARWAAMFDLLGWSWEYEPIDLPGWIPDFRVRGFLYEVCPRAAIGDHEKKILRAYPWGHRGVRILTEDPHTHLFSYEGEPFQTAGEKTVLHALFLGHNNHRRRISDWREAGNRVQWKGAGATP